MFLSGLSVLTAALALLLIPRLGRTLAFANWLVALLAGVVLLASSLVATVGPREVAKQLQARGADEIGLGIISNTRLLSVTWAAFGLMALAAVYWFFELVTECVRGRRTSGFASDKASAYGK